MVAMMVTGRQAASEVVRAVAVAGVLLSADIHLELWFDGFRRISVVGPLFMLNAIGGLAIAIAVLVWRHWLTALAAAAFGAATLVAFVISATVGLFGVHETWSGIPQQLALWAEVAALVAGSVLAVMDWKRR